MQRFFQRLTGVAAAAAFCAGIALGPAQQAWAQAQPAQGQAGQPQKKVKDQGEYDIFTAVTKDTDANKRLQDLDTWKAKYPETDFKHERLQFYLTTYQQLGKPDKMIETAKEMLALDPKDIQGLYYIALLAPDMNNTAPDMLDTTEKAANGLLTAEKPAGTAQDAWDKAKKDMDAVAHKALGWVAYNRKQYDVADTQFTKSLELNPNQAGVSYLDGLAIVAQKKADPELGSKALYEFARAAALTGPGSLPEAGKKPVNDYLTKAYTQFHGSTEGLDQLKAQAVKAPLPPAGFKVVSTADIEKAKIEKEEELKKSNPELAMWNTIKQSLNDQGDAFFNSNLKDAALPKLRGTLVEAKPAVNPKELVLAMSDASTPEVTLKLETPLRGKAKTGEPVTFEGVGDSFSKQPFMLTLTIPDKSKVQAPTEPVAPARRPVGKKSGARKKG